MVAPPKLNVAGLIGPTAPYPGASGQPAAARPVAAGAAHFHQHETFRIDHMDVHTADLSGLVRDSQRQAQMSAMRGQEPAGGLLL